MFSCTGSLERVNAVVLPSPVNVLSPTFAVTIFRLKATICTSSPLTAASVKTTEVPLLAV